MEGKKMTEAPFSFHIWAIADLHLSFGIPGKEMDVFGDEWRDWTAKLQAHWVERIQPEDLVLLPGDISWATHLEDALPDLQWIDKLPGTKVMIKGNHDYWWSSKSKIAAILPPSLHIIQNDAFSFQGVSIAGARLWDTAEFNFNAYIDIKENTPAKKLTSYEGRNDTNKKIYHRELSRLELSLKEMDAQAPLKICMTHYPPIGAELEDSVASRLLEKYSVDICVFGHLHSLKNDARPLFGEKNGIHYHLTSCDYLNFQPLQLLPSHETR
jgi:uncharacterized protein